MSERKVARRYTQALSAYARDKGEQDRVLSDIQLLRSALSGSRDLAEALKNPVLPDTAKHKAVAAVFRGRVGPVVAAFFAFLAKKRRLGILREIADAYDELEKERAGVVEGKLFVARSVDEGKKADLERRLSGKYGRTYRLAPVIRPELMGGFRLMVKDRIFDCSIENQLRRLRGTLMGEQ